MLESHPIYMVCELTLLWLIDCVFPIRISARNSPCNNLLRLFLKSVVNGGRSQPTLMQANFQIVFLKTVAQAFTSSFSCPKAQYSGMLHLSNNEDESSGTCFHLQPQPCALGSLMELQTNSKSVPVGRNEDHLLQDLDWGLHNIAGRDSCSTKDNAKKDHKEMRRRRKIGLANKGKTPWNKGRKHSAGNSCSSFSSIVIIFCNSRSSFCSFCFIMIIFCNSSLFLFPPSNL